MEQTFRNRVSSGFFWQGLSSGSDFIISFLVSILLARLLMPEDFGVIAIVNVFAGVLGVCVQAGFPQALIQKKDLDPADCSSVFFLNLILAFLLSGLLFFSAPLIAEYYSKADLLWYIRVHSVKIVICALSVVPGALLLRDMLFRLNFRITLIGNGVSGALGILLAFLDCGVWALIVQQLFCVSLMAYLQWLWGKWRPVMVLDLARLRRMFSFGWKLFCSGLLDCIYNNISPVLIGKLFSLSALSYYNRGSQLPQQCTGLVSGMTGQVLFPALSAIQDDRAKMRSLMRNLLKSIMFFVVPGLTFLFVFSEHVILILYGEKWLPAVPYMRAFLCVFLFHPLNNANLQLLTACGRSDAFLALEIIKKVQTVLIIVLTCRYGPLAMAQGLAVGGILCFAENSWLGKRLIDYGTWRQTADFLPVLILSLAGGAAAWSCTGLTDSVFLNLLTGGLVFGVVYLAGACLFRQIPKTLLNAVKPRP